MFDITPLNVNNIVRKNYNNVLNFNMKMSNKINSLIPCKQNSLKNYEENTINFGKGLCYIENLINNTELFKSILTYSISQKYMFWLSLKKNVNNIKNHSN